MLHTSTVNCEVRGYVLWLAAVEGEGHVSVLGILESGFSWRMCHAVLFEPVKVV